MKKSTNDEHMHSKTDILEYDTTSSFRFPRNVLTVHQDVDESKLDPKSSNRTDFEAEGLDNFSAKESSLSPPPEVTQYIEDARKYVEDARNSEKFAPPLENEDQSCTESEEDLLSEDYLSIENGRLIVEPLFTYKLSWRSRSIIGSCDMNLSSDGSSDSNSEDEDEVSWVDG